jgi:hypothetical protein
MMQIKKIEELKRAWGDKPCIHPLLKKAEITEDKVCATCGRTVYSGLKTGKKSIANNNDNH